MRERHTQNENTEIDIVYSFIGTMENKKKKTDERRARTIEMNNSAGSDRTSLLFNAHHWKYDRRIAFSFPRFRLVYWIAK